MRYPILVITYIPVVKDNKVFDDLVRMVLDFHRENIQHIAEAPQQTTIVNFANCPTFRIGLPFDEVMGIYESQAPIDTRYKDIVDSYTKDTYKNINELLNSIDNDSNKEGRDNTPEGEAG